MTITVPFDTGFLANSYPPKNSAVRGDLAEAIREIAKMLREDGGEFSANVYPWFMYQFGGGNVPLDFSVGEVKNTVDGHTYPSIMAQATSAVRAALLRLDSSFTADQLPITLGETGWPTGGHPAATRENAEKFMKSACESGIQMYLFEAFDETLKGGRTPEGGALGVVENNWGLLTEQGESKYDIPALQ